MREPQRNPEAGGTLRCSRRYQGPMEMKAGSEMRMYSADELDVMAEAYFKALDKLPVASPTTALTQRLVKEIGTGVASGIVDEDKLAAAAIARSNLWPDL